MLAFNVLLTATEQVTCMDITQPLDRSFHVFTHA
jgi:hypothetical protein